MWQRQGEIVLDETRLRSLMIAGLDGDRRAYQDCLEHIAAVIRRSISRHMERSSMGNDIEDVVQEILVAVHERRDTYDRSLPLMPWVYGIARYKWLTHFRKNKRFRSHVPFDEGLEAELAAGQMTAHEHAEPDLHALMVNLPASQRDLLAMTKLQGHSIAEVSVRTGVSESAVKVRIFRAMASLRKLAGVR